jgi:hypothetical protein
MSHDRWLDTLYDFDYGGRSKRLFDGHDFKLFAKTVRNINNKITAKSIRQLYCGSVYPNLEFYLEIEKRLRNVKK